MITKRTFKAIVPKSLLLARRRRMLRSVAHRFEGHSNAEIFSTVYAEGAWGRAEDRFHSGAGTRDELRAEPYVSAVQELLRTLDRPDVVDLGCGDFHVGRQLRPFAARYVAVDVVPELIERNRRLPDATDVEFRCLDIVSDPLPDGDVAIVRQVLQHLSNADIAEVVPKLRQYRHLVVTDHQPEGTFTPNLDMPTGPHIRVGLGSAVDLAAAPFHLPHVSTRELCVVPGDNGGVIRTTVYELAA